MAFKKKPEKNSNALMSKKGISIMIGYVLLISAAVVMGAIVYQWMKTYIPREPLKCPDGISLMVKNAECNTTGEWILNLTLKNNGRFDVDGYFIYATNESGQELATIDLANYTSLGKNTDGLVVFSDKFRVNKEKQNIFNLTGSGINQIYTIEILPVKSIIKDNKKRLVNCGSAKIKETLTNCKDPNG